MTDRSREKKELIANLVDKFMDVLDGPLSLDKAILLATLAHYGKLDKGDNTYIRHPLRVMEEMPCEGDMICAVMHDTIEDTELTLDNLLLLGFTVDQVKIIDCLSRRDSETYEEFILRTKKSKIATNIKIADLHDNSLLWRLKNRHLTQSDLERTQKYIVALDTLGGLDKKYKR